MPRELDAILDAAVKLIDPADSAEAFPSSSGLSNRPPQTPTKGHCPPRSITSTCEGHFHGAKVPVSVRAARAEVC
jgi:hypothetical protein